MVSSRDDLFHLRLANKLGAQGIDRAQEGQRARHSVHHLRTGKQGGIQEPELVPLGQIAGEEPHSLHPKVSVIIPLPDHRGQALACVASWVREQTYPREHLEVIVVTDGSDPVLDSRVRELLGPQDRMISQPTTNVYLLYNLGARQAGGRLLLFTESHCVAESECIEELVRFFATHNIGAACCRSVGICPNFMARMNERVREAGLRTWSQQGDWRKAIHNHGLAIYRDIYLQEGGFEHAFGHFAKWVLAEKLHSQDRRLGYAAEAVVRHYHTPSIKEVFHHIRDVTRGECAYRATSPVEYCERYFGYSEDWAHRESFRPSLARSACLAVSKSLWSGIRRGGGWSMVRAQATALLQFLPVALLGPRWRMLIYKWLLWVAVARCWAWRFNDQRLYRAYSDVYDRMIRYSRMEFIAEQLLSSVPEPPDAFHYRLSETREDWLVGFYALEQWENASFRWSGPVSIVRLSLAKGSYEVKIETRSLRKAPVPLYLGVYLNRHKVPSSSLQWNDGLLSFRIDSSMFDPSPEQRLILTCNPVRPWKFGVPDRRRLGLPIFSVRFTPIWARVSDGEGCQPPRRSTTCSYSSGHSVLMSP